MHALFFFGGISPPKGEFVMVLDTTGSKMDQERENTRGTNGGR